MSRFRPFLSAIAAIALLAPDFAGAQASDNRRASGLRTFIRGVVGGGGLAMAYISPQGEGWPVSDETALPLFTATGLATAFVVRGMSSRLDPDETHRPQFRMALGRSEKTKTDYSLALRAPISERFDVQGAVFLASNDWEKVARETRCDIFIGCFTANFVVDAKYQQSMAAIVSAVYSFRRGSDFSNTISLGAGPVMTKIEDHDEVRIMRSGALAELMLGLELGGQSRWTIDAGARVITGAGHDKPVIQLRVGRAYNN